MATYHYRCSDLGYTCSFESEGPKTEDLIPRIKMHMKYAHQIQELKPEELEKIKANFKSS
jgi:predicted small metal-binding protein